MKIEEGNFVSQLKLRNEKALDYVIIQYGGLIKSVVKKQLYHLKDYEEDCINEVFLAIWTNIAYFDQSKNTFKNWAAGIARYKAIDYVRKYIKVLNSETGDAPEVMAEDQALVAMLEQGLSEELEQMLGCLKAEDRALFVQRYVDEKDMAEISLNTGLDKAVIYNRLSRGKNKIRNLFPNEGKGRS